MECTNIKKVKWKIQGKDILTTIAIHHFTIQNHVKFLSLFLLRYGIFFSLVSGTLVYQPEVNFVTHYGATIPSGFIAPCCDGPGYMPKIISLSYRTCRITNNSHKFNITNYSIIFSSIKFINCN